MQVHYLNLVVVTLLFSVASYYLIRKELGSVVSVVVIFIKYFLVFAYFAFFWPEHGWFLLDDMTYFRGAVLLSQQGTPLHLLIHLSATKSYLSEKTGQSGSWFFYWWNNLLFRIFGYQYYIPVLFNVLLSFISGRLLVYVVRQAMISVSANYTGWLLLFFLLNWGVVSWTSFLLLKDTWVLFASLWLIAMIFSFYSRRRVLLKTVIFFVVLMVLSGIREYEIYLVVFSFFCGAVIYLRKGIIFIIFSCFFCVILIFFLENYLWFYARFVEINLFSMTIGFVRMFITPLPWHVLGTPYSFLVAYSCLNLVFFPILILGFIGLIRDINDKGRFLLILFLVTIMTYAVFPTENGSRHYYVLVWMTALAQFNGVVILLKKLASFK